jgi:tRNA A-37 threonylcarbamoyl transferase component Bud32
MKKFENETFILFSESNITDVAIINNLYGLIKKSPFLIESVNGRGAIYTDTSENDINLPSIPALNERRPIYYEDGFFLIPTVHKTSLLYFVDFDCFVKVIHPLSLKDKILTYLIDRGHQIYNLSKKLNLINLKVPIVSAYGYIKNGKKVLYVMNRIEGESLYPVMTGNESVSLYIYYNVIDELIKLHKNGYWFGDFRLSHVFINEGKVSGFVDIDSVKKNFPFKISNLAKDIAGFNHPKLPLSYTEKTNIFSYYIEKMDIKKKKKFFKLLEHYTKRRWKE